MHCGDVVRIVAEHLRGLDRREFEAVRGHLRTCPNCSAYLDSLMKTVDLYRCVVPRDGVRKKPIGLMFAD